jgi:hypothetical protein
MPRWQYFNILGNNCRLLGMSQGESERALALALPDPDDNDADDFWGGYHYGENVKVHQLPLRPEILI